MSVNYRGNRDSPITLSITKLQNRTRLTSTAQGVMSADQCGAHGNVETKKTNRRFFPGAVGPAWKKRAGASPHYEGTKNSTALRAGGRHTFPPIAPAAVAWAQRDRRGH